MHKHLKLFLLVASIAVSVMPAAAQQQDLDSVLYHAADSAVSLGGVPDEEEETERVFQYNTAQPTNAQWEKATSDKAYGYRDQREYVPKRKPPPKDPGWYKALIAFLEFLSSAAGRAMLWIGLALILGYIGYRIIRGQGSWLFGRRDPATGVALPDEGPLSEESLLEADWAARLKTAITDGNSRLAIRYSYLDVLQSLQRRGLIAYRPDKTNAAYIRELADSMQPHFRTISRQYEYAWYGAFQPDPEAMERYMQTYHGMKKSIGYA